MTEVSGSRSVCPGRQILGKSSEGWGGEYTRPAPTTMPAVGSKTSAGYVKASGQSPSVGVSLLKGKKSAGEEAGLWVGGWEQVRPSLSGPLLT